MRFLLISLALVFAASAGPACGGKKDEAAKAPTGPKFQDAGPRGDHVKGKEVYNKTCKACHQFDGSGLNGALAANFKARGRLEKKDSELINSITKGYKGKKIAMPPQSPALSAVEIKNALAYVRHKFGKKGD